MTAEEENRLRKTLELTGLNEKQVSHILSDIRFMVGNIAFRVKNEARVIESETEDAKHN